MNKGKINVSKVNILGQEYFIKSSAKSNYFKEVSKYVNSKMKEIIDEGIDPTTQQLKIAVLACMNITDELLSYKKENTELLNEIELKSSSIIEYIDEKLNK
tara:strand:- start:295 stop:597 length:303 start_codon:yes stop_codon:yes gene_type:complete